MWYIGILWIDLKLDGILLLKNAPGLSRWNPIEHLSKKHRGLVVPASLDSEDEETDEMILDNGIKILTNIDTGLCFNNFPVTPVSVFCSESGKTIEGEEYSNDKYTDQKLEENKRLLDSTVSKDWFENLNPELLKRIKLIMKHADRRNHLLIIQKV